MKVAVEDIQANPFRQIENYPIREDKVAALRESIGQTGFWDNLVARESVKGVVQIAYGHHRLAAVKEELGPDHEVDLIIRDLDDTQMIQIMARENMEEWGSSVPVEQETIRAVVKAYADGLIVLPETTRKGRLLRYAPSFIAGESEGEFPYNAPTIASFIGWSQDKVKDTLKALELVEQGVLKEESFDGLSVEESRAMVTEASKVWKHNQSLARIAEKNERPGEAKKHIAKAQNQARRVGEAVSRALRSKEKGARQAGQIALQVKQGGQKERVQRAEDFCRRVAIKIERILSGRDLVVKDLDTLLGLEDLQYVDERAKQEIVAALGALATRSLEYAMEMGGDVTMALASTKQISATHGGER